MSAVSQRFPKIVMLSAAAASCKRMISQGAVVYLVIKGIYTAGWCAGVRSQTGEVWQGILGVGAGTGTVWVHTGVECSLQTRLRSHE